MRYSDEELLTELPRLVRLDPATGKLYWLARTREMFSTQRSFAAWASRHSGKEAFATPRSDGYLAGRVVGRTILAHRVVFALVHGRWPAGDIDHINHAGTDNRPENLREVSHQENHRNQRLRTNNTSGAMGVNAFRSQWQASIIVDGVKRHLGTFRSFDGALVARKAAEERLGFHPNHGAVAA